MIVFDSKNDEALQTFQRQNKKINKNKEFDFDTKMNLILERKKFINNICWFKNKN